MENKVQEITDKIYREGVEKGNVEAQKIIDAAEIRRNEIMKKAHHEAEKIIADAKKSAEELTQHTHSELKLYAGRAIEALKSEIANLVTHKILDYSLNETVNNEWLQKLMLTLATDWVKRENVVLQTTNADALTQYFISQAKELLDKGVQIEQVNGKETEFTIMPADKSYKVQFGKDEFADYFKEFLRPKLVELLFTP